MVEKISDNREGVKSLFNHLPPMLTGIEDELQFVSPQVRMNTAEFKALP